MPRKSTLFVAACGEHFVASFLSGFRLIVALPRAGIPGTDLFVSRENGGPAIRLQVKTGTQATKKDKEAGPIYLWHSTHAAADGADPNLWYAYVWLKGWPQKESPPEVFFVPSQVVADCMKLNPKDQMPFFWMRANEIKQHEGYAGLQLMLAAMEASGPAQS